MGSHLTPQYDIFDYAGWAELTRHAPHSHVASLRIHVYAHCRGKGHGRRLIQRVLFCAKRLGIRRVEATPYTDNLVSTRFFAQLDEFEHEGFRRFGGRRDGQLVDTHLYAWVDA